MLKGGQRNQIENWHGEGAECGSEDVPQVTSIIHIGRNDWQLALAIS